MLEKNPFKNILSFYFCNDVQQIVHVRQSSGFLGNESNDPAASKLS